MSIKEDLAPAINYIVEEIAGMNYFDKDRAKLLLTIHFGKMMDDIYSNRSISLAGEITNNQRHVQHGGVRGKDANFLQTTNRVLKEKMKECNRMASFGKDIVEFHQLKKVIIERHGKEGLAEIMDAARMIKIQNL